MLESFQGRITLLPPLNELLERFECFFRSDIPLIGSTYLFEFFHNLLLVPGLDLVDEVPF